MDNLQETNKFSLSSEGSLGIFTTVALILLLWGFCWLKSYTPFSSQQHINVMFKQVSGLHSGAFVFVDGVKAGVVENVDWKDNNQVLVRLSITHPHMIIPQGAQFNILANGIIGARYMDIIMPNIDKSVQEPIDESTIVMGGDVLRPEIILDKIGHDLDKIDIDSIQENISEDGKVLRKAANQFSALANKTMPVMDRALPLEYSLIAVSTELRKTTHKLDNFIDNPKLSPELRQTIKEARQTAQMAQSAIHELNNTLTDKSVRQDLFDTMHQLNEATLQLERSMETLHSVSKDTELRSDVKQILFDARKSLEKLDHILNNPDSGADIKSTLKNTRATLEDVDLAARQLQQILDKRQPLIHMFLGRPGHIKAN